jgi:hypothetical protein
MPFWGRRFSDAGIVRSLAGFHGDFVLEGASPLGHHCTLSDSGVVLLGTTSMATLIWPTPVTPRGSASQCRDSLRLRLHRGGTSCHLIPL